jgi:type I restriction enzyme S subunit
LKTRTVHVGELALNDSGAFKIGPFGSSLKKTELVESGIPVAGIENVLPNNFVKGFRRFITSRKFEELSDYEILPDDVLVTTMGTIGRAASAPRDIGRVIFDSHLFRMRVDTSRVFPPYLCYALNSDLVASQLARMARGAIMDGLNTTILRECSIPLPEISEQRRIAGQLEQADRLRRTRRYALELTDTFLPAAFLDLFGDLIENPHGFRVEPLENLIQPTRPISYGILMPGPDVPNGVPYIRVTDIQDGQVVTALVRRTTREIDEAYKRSKLKAGDLLLSIRGHVGRMAIVPACLEGANITQDTARLATVDMIETYYVMGCLASRAMQRRMAGLTRGAAVQGINLGDVKELPIPVPQLPLQQKFAALVERVERLRAVQREALRQAEHLFASLLHRAFSG